MITPIIYILSDENNAWLKVVAQKIFGESMNDDGLWWDRCGNRD
jgi:hypothetical protein